MKDRTVAKRYAKALYETAVDTNGLADVLQGMTNIAYAIKNVPELNRALLNPLVTDDEKKRIIKEVSSNKVILQFITILARRKRLDLLVAINEELVLLSDAAKGIHRVLVRTASEITDDQKKHIEKDLVPVVGGKVVGKFEVAKDLLGGIWIKMGDKVLDATLRRRVDDLRFALAHSTN